jgi:hypothetical protein
VSAFGERFGRIDRSKLLKDEDYPISGLHIGRVIAVSEDSDFLAVDFGVVKLKILKVHFIEIEPIPYFIGDKVLALGDEAEIVEAFWNFRREYPYFIVRKGKRLSTNQYKIHELAPLIHPG